MTENDDLFGSRVKAIRNQLGLKQKDFIAKLGISLTNLSEIENGRTKPGYYFFIKISNTFNVNLDYLFFGRGKMFSGVEEVGAGKLSDFDNLMFRPEDLRPDIREFLENFFNNQYIQYRVLADYVRIIGEGGNSVKPQELDNRDSGSDKD